jgi:hypothetical protein
MTTTQEDRKLGALFDRLCDTTGQDKVAIKDVVTAIGGRGMIPFLLVPAFLTATPLSGIPGVSATAGIIIALVSFRMLLGYDTLPLPRWVERRSVDGQRLDKVLEKSRPVVNWIDRHARQRWDWLFRRPVIWVPQGLCLASGLCMPFLEFIPFTSSIVAAGVCLLALAMLVRDGVIFLLALLPYAAMIAILVAQVL